MWKEVSKFRQRSEGDRQPYEIMEPCLKSSKRNLQNIKQKESQDAAAMEITIQDTKSLIDEMLDKENMKLAYKQVVKNKGAPGVDKMTTEDLKRHLVDNWQYIKDALLNGKYKPQPVKEVEIPKPGGGVRKLGIPTVVDRLIQQALHQILSPIFEKEFSESSYGFRPGRSTHQAVLKAQEYVSSGRRWVVDMDLEKFFDRVNHDILMSRVERKVKDKRILLLIRRYLQAGIFIDGLESIRSEGTPQGGPLSPLLSNILLDDLDKELEARGHAFCRYADDCNIYVKSEEAGKRILGSIKCFLERKLKLKINESKSAVDRPWNRKFLGYSMTVDKETKLKISPKALERLKDKLKDKFKKGRGQNILRVIENIKPILVGWSNYFKLAKIKTTLDKLDAWIRRKIRCIIWRQKKRAQARYRMLVKNGLSKERAKLGTSNGKGSWWNAGASHMNQAFTKLKLEEMGLISTYDRIIVS